MRTFAERPKAIQQNTSAKSTISGLAQFGQSRELNPILDLRLTIGNQAGQRLLQFQTEDLDAGPAGTVGRGFSHDFSCIPIYAGKPSLIQTKLTVNKPGDEYEQEADWVAERVIRIPEPQMQRLEGEGPFQAKSLADQIRPLMQGQEEPEEEEHLRPKLAGELQRQCIGCAEEDTAIQVRPAGGRTLHAAPGLAARIDALSQSAGQPLPASARAFFEPRFGYDFGQVRIHVDSQAAEIAQLANARAFAIGRDIGFGSGQYSPETGTGRRLLAHELAHVVQQSDGEIQRTKPWRRGIVNQDLASYAKSDDKTSMMADSLSRIQKPTDILLIQTDNGRIESSSSERALTSRELELVDHLIMAFDQFHDVLRDEMRDREISAPPIDRFMDGQARLIRQITEPLPSRSATIPLLSRLIRLYDRYLNLFGHSAPILDIIRDNETIQQVLSQFRRTLRRAHEVPGVPEEIRQQTAEAREAEEQRRREEEAAQWVSEITPNPDNPRSRIMVGELSGTWRVFKIHRAGQIYAVNESTLEVATFTPEQWYSQRGVAYVVASFAWLRALSQSKVIQYLAGLAEGFGQSLISLVQAVIRIDQTVRGIYHALSNLGETGRALWQAVIDWKNRFLREDEPQQARMIGRLVGSLLFEIVLTRGVGRLATVTRAREALSALRSGSVTVVRQAAARLAEGAGSAGRAIGRGVLGVLERLRLMGLYRIASTVLDRALEVVRGTLRVAGDAFAGVLYVTREAFYFLFDGARDAVAYIGRSLDNWAWGQRNGFAAASAFGAAHLDDLAAQLYRWLSTRRRAATTGSGIAAGARGLARISPQARAWLTTHFGTGGALPGRIQASLLRAGDDIIEAINRFHNVDGFMEVARDYLVRGGRFQQGARYVMRFARVELSDRVEHAAIRFEFPSSRGIRISGRPREVDIFVEGMRYELKSVFEINEATIRRQLIPDLISQFGNDLSNLRNLRWLFDSRRIGINRAEAVGRIQRIVQNHPYFESWGRSGRMTELLNSIDDIVRYWP